MKKVWLSALAVFALAACNATPPATGGNVTPPPASPAPPVASGKITPAIVLAASSSRFEQDTLSLLMVSAVQFARSESGSSTAKAGTITETAPRVFAFNPSPIDRLIVAFQNGTRTEFVVTRLEGDLSGDNQRFIRANHRFEYRVKSSAQGELGVLDLNIVSTRVGADQVVTSKGSVGLNGAAFTVDLRYAQRIVSDFGQGSVTFQFDDALTGTVSAANFLSQIDETTAFKVVSVNNAIAQNIRTINSSWSDNGRQFRVQNGVVKTVFKDGNAVEADFWNATGTLVQDGQVVGNFTKIAVGNSIELALKTATEKIVFNTATF